MAASKARGFFGDSPTEYGISDGDARQLLEDIGRYDQREQLNAGLNSKVFILDTDWDGRLEIYGDSPNQRYRLELWETGDVELGLLNRLMERITPAREPITSFTIEGDIPPGYDVEEELGLEAR